MREIKPIRDFDHLMCGVKDLKTVESTFEGLGFTVGPITPLEGIGVANRRILLTPKQPDIANYLEFMQLGGASGDIPSFLQKWLKSSLTGDEGAHSYIMRTDDAHYTFNHFSKRHEENPDGGFAPILLEKDFQEAGPGEGQVYDVGFSNCIMPDLEPPLYVSTSQIRTLDFYFNDFWRSHSNGAVSWVATVAVSETPFETATALQDIWGGTVERMGDDGASARLEAMPLFIYTPDRFTAIYGIEAKDAVGRDPFSPYTAGVHITVKDIAETEHFLESRGIDIVRKNHHIIVPPELAHGVMLCLEQDPDVEKQA